MQSSNPSRDNQHQKQNQNTTHCTIHHQLCTSHLNFKENTSLKSQIPKHCRRRGLRALPKDELLSLGERFLGKTFLDYLASPVVNKGRLLEITRYFRLPTLSPGNRYNLPELLLSQTFMGHLGGRGAPRGTFCSSRPKIGALEKDFFGERCAYTACSQVWDAKVAER